MFLLSILSKSVVASQSNYCDSSALKGNWAAQQSCITREIRNELERCSNEVEISHIKVIGTEPVLYFQSNSTNLDCLDSKVFKGLASRPLSSFEGLSNIQSFQNKDSKFEYVISKQTLHMLYTPSDFGVSVHLTTPSSILFSSHYATHSRNYVINLENNNLYEFPNGDVSFNGENFVVSGIKTYGADVNADDYPGAIWYTAVISETGEIVDLLDADGPTSICLNISQIPNELRLIVRAKQRDKLCVKR